MRLIPRGAIQVRLRTKLVFWFLMASILPLLLAGYLAYRAIAQQAEQAAVREVVTIAESASKTATEFMNSRCSDVLVWAKLSVVTDALQSAEMREEASDTLREMVKLSGAYEAAALVDVRRGWSVASSWSGLKNVNFSNSKVVNEAKEGHIVLGPLEQNKMVEQLDKDSNGWTLAIAAPVKLAGNVVGVVIAYLRWKSLENLLTGTRVAQTGYVFVIDGSGRIIVHPNQALNGMQVGSAGARLGALWKSITEQKTSVTYESSTSDDGKSRSRTAGIAYPGPTGNLPALGWKIVADAPSNEVLLLPNIVRILGTIALAVAIMVFILSFVLASRISKPIAAIAEVSQRVADRDLTVEAADVSRSDEIGDLGRAFGSMLESLRSQISQLLQGTAVLKGVAPQISTTVSEVASNIAQVAASVTETAATTQELRQSAKISGDKARNLADAARQALGASAKGREATDGTIERMKVIKTQVESVGETVVQLSEQSQAIERIISTVQDLADQSNLLAVNASIEAARAGEMGRGFAVVAHEIKSLADQSRRATVEVAEILESTQKWISAVVMSTEQVNKAVLAGIEQSSQAGAAIAVLNSSVEMSSEAAGVIEASSKQQSLGMDQVSNAMASIEEAINQNLAGVRQLEDAAGRLADLGENLRMVIELYRT